MEVEKGQVCEKEVGEVTDGGMRKLLGDLEEIERKHQVAAEAMEESIAPSVKKTEDEAQRRLFVLQIVQPGLAGVVDGTVSAAAPVFAAAFAAEGGQRCVTGVPALLVGWCGSSVVAVSRCGS